MTDLDKGLFAFASYNAGPTRIRQLRSEAAKRGLDPNVWFDNVERLAAEKIGRETVTYVSNISNEKWLRALPLALGWSSAAFPTPRLACSARLAARRTPRAGRSRGSSIISPTQEWSARRRCLSRALVGHVRGGSGCAWTCRRALCKPTPRRSAVTMAT